MQPQPNWKFHTLVLSRVLTELDSALKASAPNSSFYRAETAELIHEGREALNEIIQHLSENQFTAAYKIQKTA